MNRLKHRTFTARALTVTTLTLLSLILGAASPSGCKPQHLRYQGKLHVEESDYYPSPLGTHEFTLSIRELRMDSQDFLQKNDVSYNFTVQFTQLGTGFATGTPGIDIEIPAGAKYAVVTAEMIGAGANYDKVFYLATTSLEDSTVTGIGVYGIRAGSKRVTRIAWAGALPEPVATAWISQKEWQLSRQDVMAER